MIEGRTNAPMLGNVVVEEADDGSSGLKVLREGMGKDGHLFDVVLIDNLMTEMNGPDAVRVMRDELHFRGSIIGVTGNAMPEDIAYFEQCGADCVVTKPLTNKKLMDAIYSTIRNKNIP